MELKGTVAAKQLLFIHFIIGRESNRISFKNHCSIKENVIFATNIVLEGVIVGFDTH